MSRIQAKLRSSSGESISEVLVAMLVIALGIVMLVSMISASGNMIRRSEKVYADYMEQFNAMEAQDSLKGSAQQVPITMTGENTDPEKDPNTYRGSIRVWTLNP